MLHTQTDRQTNSIMAPCTHPGMERLFCPKENKGLRSLRFLGLVSLLVERYMSQGGLILAAGRVRSKKKDEQKARNPASPQSHHEIHSSPATATTSRRSATKHVPRVSRYSAASKDPGFVEIGLVQLSQSVKTTNVTHTHRQTDGLTN